MNQLNYFYETWYKHYAFGGYPNSEIFNLLQSVITTWRTCQAEATLAPQNSGPEAMYGTISWENMLDLLR
jgi:hypothetical protein